mgnify:CR=1 FL=1
MREPVEGGVVRPVSSLARPPGPSLPSGLPDVDIVLVGDSGRWMSILILGVGVGLFLRLAQSIFRPNKVRYKCEGCGLLLHEPDAVHCKHCGREIQIETKGDAV